MTVLGRIPAEVLGVTDAHNHLWIAPVAGTSPDLPQLCHQPAILQELLDYRQAGGGSIVDCQPGGCGRDGRSLRELSRLSGVHVVASTGFHLARYYTPDYWLFLADVQQAQAHFLAEIRSGLEETRSLEHPVQPGVIKVACQAQLSNTPQALLEAAANASLETGLAIEVHTEKGSAAEEILSSFTRCGLASDRLVLCHMDKRPDFGLHCELAQAGVNLEYDTFYRPKYQPEKYLWPLLTRMVANGTGGQIALATDIAEASFWTHLGNGPGLAGLLRQVRSRLITLGFDDLTIQGLLGGNIACCLAIPD